MGKIRTKTVKKAAKQIVEKYYTKLCLDFQVNKRVIDDIALIQSKRMRNQIAGYVTRLMKRVERAPKGVKGISLKLQEEQREKRLDFVPDESALDLPFIKIDVETKNMLREMGMSNLNKLQVEKRGDKKTNEKDGKKGAKNMGGRMQGNRNYGGLQNYAR